MVATNGTKLSSVQRYVLSKMRKGKTYTALELHASIATLRTLEREGLVTAQEHPGPNYSPRTSIGWMRAAKE